MDYSLVTQRLGQQLRQRRLNRGLTQAALASLACLTRQKVIAIEKGDLSVGMMAYARVLLWMPSSMSCPQSCPHWTKSMQYSIDGEPADGY